MKLRLFIPGLLFFVTRQASAMEALSPRLKSASVESISTANNSVDVGTNTGLAIAALVQEQNETNELLKKLIALKEDEVTLNTIDLLNRFGSHSPVDRCLSIGKEWERVEHRVCEDPDLESKSPDQKCILAALLDLKRRHLSPRVRPVYSTSAQRNFDEYNSQERGTLPNPCSSDDDSSFCDEPSDS